MNRIIRNLAVTGITIVSATSLTALPWTGASAATTARDVPLDVTICNDIGCLQDNGHGKIVTLEDSGTVFLLVETEEIGGNPAYFIEHGSDCLNVSPSNHKVYDDSCPGDASETWVLAPDGALHNLNFDLNMTATSIGGDVYVAGGPPNGLNQWGLL